MRVLSWLGYPDPWIVLLGTPVLLAAHHVWLGIRMSWILPYIFCAVVADAVRGRPLPTGLRAKSLSEVFGTAAASALEEWKNTWIYVDGVLSEPGWAARVLLPFFGVLSFGGWRLLRAAMGATTPASPLGYLVPSGIWLGLSCLYFYRAVRCEDEDAM